MKHLKTIAKILISVLIIGLILRKIDEKLLLSLLRTSKPFWLLWATIWFIISKIIAAYRFNTLIAVEGVRMTGKLSLRLYWLGMYYNLLLPGGISGDAYKIRILMKKYQQPFKRMFAVTLLDRLSGMVTLGQICLLLLPGIPVFARWWWLSAILVLLAVGFSKKVYVWAGGALKSVWAVTTVQSLTVQISQVIAAVGIVLALSQGIYWLEYTVLFLISSVVAMLPLTIGGAGARELTFLYGAAMLSVNSEQAVAIAFLFYLISSAVALAGVVFSFEKESTGI